MGLGPECRRLERGVTRGFLFTLAVMGMALVAALPAVGALILLHRHTRSRTVFWLGMVGFLIYAAVAATTLAVVAQSSGLAEWVES